MNDVETIRCPTCDARNAAAAPWCTQCYGPLTAPVIPAAAAPPDPVPTTPVVTTPVSSTDGLLPLPGEERPVDDAEVSPVRAGGGRFREVGGRLQWACVTCDEWCSIDDLVCSRCGSPFGHALGASAPDPTPDVPPALLIAASLVLPGAGHGLLRLWGPGFVRALLGLVWGVGGLTLLLGARASGQSAAPAMPLLMGWFLLAVGSANDAVVAAGGQGQEQLGGRRLLWLVVAVLGATMAMAAVGAMSVVGGR